MNYNVPKGRYMQNINWVFQRTFSIDCSNECYSRSRQENEINIINNNNNNNSDKTMFVFYANGAWCLNVFIFDVIAIFYGLI